MRLFALIILVIVSNHTQSQYAYNAIGINLSGFKLYRQFYSASSVISENYGPIAVINNSYLSPYTDIGVFYRFRHNNYYIEPLINLGSVNYRINKKGVFTTGLQASKVFVTSNPLQLGLYSGIRLYGKRAVNVFLRAGISYDIVQSKNNYNPINFLIEGVLNRPAHIALYGEPVLLDANAYSISPISIKTGPEFHFSHSMLGLLTEFRWGSEFYANKSRLINNVVVLQVHYSFLLSKKLIFLENE